MTTNDGRARIVFVFNYLLCAHPAGRTAMTPEDRRHAEDALDRGYYTIAAATRILCISKATMRKWLDLRLIQVTEIGPPGYAVRKIARSEIERLRRVA